jgi:hypothetical protein
VAVAALSAWPAAAGAQLGVDAQVWRPAAFSSAILGTDRAATIAQWDVHVHAWYQRTSEPLHLALAGVDGQVRDRVVIDDSTTYHLGFTMGMGYGIELAIDLPIVTQSLDPDGFGRPPVPGAPTGFYQIMPASNVAPGGTVPGDARLGAKLQGVRSARFGLGGALTLTLPFGDETQFAGSRSATLEPKLIGDMTMRRVALAFDLGFRWHAQREVVSDPSSVLAGAPRAVLADANELFASAAAAWPLWRWLALVGELSHVEPVGAGAGLGDATTDVLAGLRARVGAGAAVVAAAGAGVEDARRRDHLRLVLGVTWTTGEEPR